MRRGVDLTNLIPQSGLHVVGRGENDGKEKKVDTNGGQVSSADPPQLGWLGLVSAHSTFAEKSLSGWSSTAVLARVGSWMRRSGFDDFVHRFEGNPHILNARAGFEWS